MCPPKLDEVANLSDVLVGQAQIIAQTGPLPPSSELAEYERICPGAALRIIEVYAQEQAARAKQEEISLHNKRVLDLSLTIASLILAVVGLFTGADALSAGQVAEGVAYSGGGLLALALATLQKKKRS